MKSKTEFRVSAGELLGALLKVSRVVSSRSHILFEVKDGVLTVAGSNYETQIEVSVNPDGQPSDVAFCLDNSIVSLLKLLPEQPLAITVTQEKEKGKDRELTSTGIRIAHFSGKTEIQAYGTDEYTGINHAGGEAFTIPAGKLKRGLDKTRKFTSDDTLRPPIMTVYLDITPDGIVFVGSDGFALSRFKDMSLKGINAGSFMIGTDAANNISALIKGTEDAVINIGKKSISVRLGNTTVTSMATEGKYPNYNMVIPADNPVSFTVDGKYLSAAASRLLVSVNDPNGTVVIDGKDSGVRLSSIDSYFNRFAEEKIPVRCVGDIEIGAKGSLMVAVADMINGEAILSFSEPNRPFLITPETEEEDTALTILLMPAPLGDNEFSQAK